MVRAKGGALMSDEKLLEKTPPRDLDSEMSTLGAILLQPEVLHDIAQVLTADDFYATSHRIIYQAMLELLDQSSAIDVVILKNQLHQAQQLEAVGGSDYLLRLAESVPSAANAS